MFRVFGLVHRLVPGESRGESQAYTFFKPLDLSKSNSQKNSLINTNMIIDLIYYPLFNTFHIYLLKKSLNLSLSSIITFFSSLSFSSIAFLQLNSIAFLSIPISPPCSVPHQHEHSRSCLMK